MRKKRKESQDEIGGILRIQLLQETVRDGEEAERVFPRYEL